MIYNLVLYLLLTAMIGMAIFVIRSKNIRASIFAMTIFSLISTLIYSLFDAPDVAMTEAAVNACISTIFLLQVTEITKVKTTTIAQTPLNSLALLIITAIFIFLALYTTPFGQEQNPTNQHVANYYLANTPKEIGIDSVVTAVLASYRGFDTLGETIVILTAGISVLAILAGVRKE